MTAKLKKPRKKSKATVHQQADDASVRKNAVAATIAPAPPGAALASSSSRKKKNNKKKGGVDNIDGRASKNPEKGRDGKNKKTKQLAEEKPRLTEDSSDDNDDDEGSDDVKLTLEALDAMSDDDTNDPDGSKEESDEEGGDGGDNYDAEALALRKMIQDGKFDGLLKNAKKSKKKDGTKKAAADKKPAPKEDERSDIGCESDALSDEEVEEVVMDAASTEGLAAASEKVEEKGEGEEESDEESESEDDEDAAAPARRDAPSLALATAMEAADRRLPWAETFAVVPPTPLPFGPPPSATTAAAAGKKRPRSEEDEGGEEEEEEHVDVHDDLKREVAFYDNALEGALLARKRCEGVGIPFTRPDDFFAEMVKSDDHMAKIKDRLIFETKKMEAVERRKSNKEQTLMAKERHAHRLAEKSKAKKAHMQSVEDWKKSAERGRTGLGGKVQDWQEDEDRLQGMGGGGANGKRAAANKRYGFGGKRARFKQNDKKTLNDMSGYNPRGGFGGVGQKSQGGGGGKKRPGKRARDATRTGR